MNRTSQSRRPRPRKLASLGLTSALAAGASLLALPTGAPASVAATQADTPPNPLTKPGWVLERNDEFNGSLDSSLWVTKYLESRTTVDRASARYGFRDNALVLRIDDDQPTYYEGTNPMKVSSIQTGQLTGLHKSSPLNHTIPTKWNYTPQHGYFEIRAKSSARSGVHTAFWTVGRQDTPTQNAEIDIIEDPGTEPNSFAHRLLKWSDPSITEVNKYPSFGFDITQEMHIYGLEWTPTQLKLYVDNVLTNTIDQSPAYPSAFFLGIYENAGWTGTVDPTDPRPKEFVVDYFRAYRKADPLTSGATYKIKNAATGQYLDSDGSGTVTATGATTFDDQDWVVAQQPSGAWTIRNVRTGRFYLDSDSTNNRVITNAGDITPDSTWTMQSVTGGFRFDNNHDGRGYLYATSAGELKWNTGSTGPETVWVLERK